MKKIAIVLGVTVLFIGFFASGLPHWFTLGGLKSGLGWLRHWRESAPLLTGLVLFAAYVLVAALSLPGAAVMTLSSGALFGDGWGTLIASFASSVGATLAFLAARILLRDTVQARWGGRLAVMGEGINREGAVYLLSLRLVPVFPFFLVNLLMGLTSLRVWTFYWVSQLGMLPVTWVYVNAGTQLATLDHLSGVLTPALLGSLLLLAVVPLLARWALALLQRRRVYARWQKPRYFDRNLVVIGAGAAGLVTAYIAAALKARVTLIEGHKMGGDCLNYGCVPSKALIKSARVAHLIRHGQHYGLTAGTPTFSFREVMARVHRVIGEVAPHDSVERYTALGVEVLQGHARLLDPWTVEIESPEGCQRLTTRSMVIATGAQPFIPPLPGIETVKYVTSDTLWDEFAQLDAPPGRLVVLGGGPIGCELAQSLARLGSAVTQVERGTRLMAREDEEVCEWVRAALTRDGVEVLTGHSALRCEREAESARQFLVIAMPEGQERRIEFDVLLCAVGRVARLAGYGLEELGIETQRTVVTNDYLETLYPNIYAAGDVAGPYQFTHTAAHQAWYAAVNALLGEFKRFKVDNSVVPWTTFIDPEVARVGLNEQEAREKGIPHEVSRYDLDDLDRALADGVGHGFVKILTVPGRDRILGVTIVGEQAGELLAEYVLAMKHGLGLNKILATIHTYPTLSEANKYAAGVWKKAHAPQRLLAWLSRYHAFKRRST